MSRPIFLLIVVIAFAAISIVSALVF